MDGSVYILISMITLYLYSYISTCNINNNVDINGNNLVEVYLQWFYLVYKTRKYYSVDEMIYSDFANIRILQSSLVIYIQRGEFFGSMDKLGCERFEMLI